MDPKVTCLVCVCVCVRETQDRLTDVGSLDGQVILLLQQVWAELGHHLVDASHHVHGAVHHLPQTQRLSISPLPIVCSKTAGLQSNMAASAPSLGTGELLAPGCGGLARAGCNSRRAATSR